MAEFTIKSWSNDAQLDDLARFKRDREIVRGVVTSISIIKDKEIAFLLLENGVTAYCPAEEFSAHEFRSLNGFAGTMQEFIVTNLDLDQEVAIVSIKQADEMKKAKFLSQLEVLEQSELLHTFEFDGVVTGMNLANRNIFVRINGVDAVMYANDYSWDRSRRVEEQVQRGEKIKVKVIRFNKENNLIRVSRRHTLEDPFVKLEALQNHSAVAGRVTGVDPVHGIFIQLDVGLEVKGVKPNQLEEPIVGDIVSCRVRSIDKEKRQAKVVITGYPRGKKKRKDVGAFLFE
ncbi:S1 RNA-binding domain-containing protein [Robertmurraya beringensis]|uniref:S1 RNA-binding domain-containing protein n=1 Tax=Robertmurraya beringensis TaxID=641660 RepID=A0ABV6KTX4_9BACI